VPKKVGVPRALLYYKFDVLWKTYFEKLGAELIISPESNSSIKKLAVTNAPDEDCYSTKLYFGHTLSLKDKVDFLFIPRFQSDHKTNISCPKFMGLADVLRSMFKDLPPIIRPYFSMAKKHHRMRHLLWKAFKVGYIFTRNPFRIVYASIEALKKHSQFYRKLHLTEKQLQLWEQNLISFRHGGNRIPVIEEYGNISSPEKIKIALAGHSYVLNDKFQSLDIAGKILQHGAEYITSEQIPRTIVEAEMAKLDFNMYFQYEREILGTIMYFLDSKTVDGIIHVMIFSCGPDSVAGEMASRIAHLKQDVPLLQLTFDELTGEAGLNTRLEAFFDMIIRKKEKKQPVVFH